MVILLLGSCPRTRTLEQRQVALRATLVTRLVRAVGFYGSDRPTVLETNCKLLIPFGFEEIGFVW